MRSGTLRSCAWLLALSGAAATAPSCLVSQDGSPYLIDGGALGPCSGNEARAIPATECPNVACCGPTAFALCLGSRYSDCSCTLLAGKVLVNASGQAIDAASIGTDGDCGAPDGGAAEGGTADAEAGAPGDAGRATDAAADATPKG